jgi:RING-H2 zinc finger protein RHA1
MGFPLVCYCFAVPKPLVTLCRLLRAVRDAVLLMLAVVGLCSFPPYGAATAADAPLPEDVKQRLPEVEYAQLLAEQHQSSLCHGEGDGEAASSTCIVCLERLEATDEVRRLGGCAHAFHRGGCIDRWMDLGRATCPLCRSSLLPRARGGPLVLARLASLLTRPVR